jgi:hypothetical protein
MTQRPIRIILSLVALLSSAGVLAAPPLGTVGTSGSQPIRNRVLDLLDETIVLNTTGVAVWESTPFDTSQFEWAGLHVSAASLDGNVRCETAWRYGADDEAVLGSPATSSRTEINRAGGSLLPGPIVVPIAATAGLEARIVCRIEIVGVDSRGDPPQATGTISDVKVLLRKF